MHGQIFISYRREDSAHVAGRIFDRLSQHFGKDQIFMDLDTIELGVDFVNRIENAVSVCDVLLVLIGKGWLDAKDRAGQRRLDQPHDFVRIEISAALARDIFVIPVLVDGATMPTPEDLPEELAYLARRNGMPLDYVRFDSDMDKLIKALEDTLKQAPKERHLTMKSGVSRWVWFVGGVVLLSLLGVWLYNGIAGQDLFQSKDSLYDDFENAAYDESFDRSKWSFSTDTSSEVVQRNGALIITKAAAAFAESVHASEYENFRFEAPTSFEARLKLQPDEQANGSIAYGVSFNLPSGEDLYVYCSLNYYGPVAFCGEQASWLSFVDIYTTRETPIALGSWYTFRIEIDFETLEIAYFIDDQPLGADTPTEVTGIQDATQSMYLLVFGEGRPITGYFDDVRIGPFQK